MAPLVLSLNRAACRINGCVRLEQLHAQNNRLLFDDRLVDFAGGKVVIPHSTQGIASKCSSAWLLLHEVRASTGKTVPTSILNGRQGTFQERGTSSVRSFPGPGLFLRHRPTCTAW